MAAGPFAVVLRSPHAVGHLPDIRVSLAFDELHQHDLVLDVPDQQGLTGEDREEQRRAASYA